MKLNTKIEITKLLVKREYNSKYGRTALGYFWPIMQPLVTLVLYSFVFIYIFKARWSDDTTAPFSLIFFAGIIAFYFFSDILNQSSNLFMSNVNFIKKIKFPLLILPIKVVVVHAVQMCINFAVWFLIAICFSFELHITILLLPILIFAFVFFGVAFATIISVLGVIWKDLGHVSPLLSQFLLFSAPIFYPLSAVPEFYRFFIYLNPLTVPVELIRDLIIYGHTGDYTHWLSLFLQIIIFSVIAGLLFSMNKKKFAERL